MSAVKKFDEIIQKLKSKSAPRVIIIYGPDIGICKQYIEEAARTFIAQHPSIEIQNFSEEDLTKDFSNFESAVRGASLFGGANLALVRLRNESASQALSKLIIELETSNLLEGGIFIYSSHLTNKSNLVNTCEKSGRCLSLRLFAPSRLELMNILKSKAASENVTLSPDAIDIILNHSANDSQSLVALMENLALYVGIGGEINKRAIDALSIDNKEGAIDEMLNSAFVGRTKETAVGAARILRGGANPIQLLNNIIRRVNLLIQINAESSNGGSLDDIVKERKFNIFWKEQENIKRQAAIWKTKSLDRVLHELVTADKKCKTSGAPQHEIVEALLLRIAEFSRALQGRF